LGQGITFPELNMKAFKGYNITNVLLNKIMKIQNSLKGLFRKFEP